MAYATSGEVIKYTGRAQFALSSSSPVSVDDILEIIDDLAAEIDGLVQSLDVTLPIVEADSPYAYAVLKRLNALGAAYTVELRLFGDASPGDARNARFTTLREDYLRLLQQIKTGDILLSDADGATNSDADLAASTGYRDSNDEIVDPFFKRKDKY